MSSQDGRSPRRASAVAKAARSEVLAKASHDIRTSLNTVLGTVDLLGDTRLSPSQARLVQVLQRAGNRLLALVDELFDPSQARAALKEGRAESASPIVRSQTEASPSRSVSATPLSGLRVLLVDDSAESRALVKAYLEPSGAILALAESAPLALEKLTHDAFDVVLMDLRLPGVDGFEATRELRRSERERGVGATPVVALSADARADARARALAEGFNDYLTKPIRKDDLVTSLSRYKASDASHAEPAWTIRSPTVAALLPKFIARREKDLLTIREALARKDYRAIALIGHNLRGNGVSYGFQELSTIGEQLEKAADASRRDRIEAALETLEISVKRIRREVGDGIALQPRPESRTQIRAIDGVAPRRKSKGGA